jgi:uncharacterized membrane protein
MIGGFVYVGIEYIYKGNSQISMFITGGICFILIGGLNEYLDYEMPLLQQMAISAFIITGLELITGLIVNIWLGWNVWDYSHLPFNFLGQICLQFSIIWFFLSLVGIILDDYLRWRLFGEEKPHYFLLRKKNKNKK